MPRKRKFQTIEEVEEAYASPDEYESRDDRMRRLARRRGHINRIKARANASAEQATHVDERSTDNHSTEREAKTEDDDPAEHQRRYEIEDAIQQLHNFAMEIDQEDTEVHGLDTVLSQLEDLALSNQPVVREFQLQQAMVRLEQLTIDGDADDQHQQEEVLSVIERLSQMSVDQAINEPAIARRRRIPDNGDGIAIAEIDDFDPSIAVQHSIGNMDQVCTYCKALRWKGELPGMCCLKGAVQLAPPEQPPPALALLWSNAGFMKRIRAYNSLFAFTSMGASVAENVAVDERYANGRDGVYTFRVQGTICHRIGTLLPPDNRPPTFAQIYVHDSDMGRQVERRMDIMDGLNREILTTIQEVLTAVNPFVQQFMMAGDFARRGQDLQLIIHDDPQLDLRRYNRPTADEVAAIIVDENVTSERDIVLHTRDGALKRISDLHPAYDPLHFPLLHPFGEYGWSPHVQYVDGVTRYRNSRVSTREFYAYQLFSRPEYPETLLRSGRLFQQWCVEQYVKTELERLRYIRTHQARFRAELYKGVVDAMLEDGNLGRVGRFVLLPPTFTGGARYMRKQYHDSMAIVREVGKPDLFITVTCNPEWPEIKAAIGDQTTDARPDIVSRVFKLKLEAIKKDIIQNRIFGGVVAHMHVIEFQKRGLPHAHMLIKLDEGASPRTTEDYDRFVCAEIPDPNKYPLLHEVVTRSMIHTPCTGNPKAPCMKDGKCSKRFPRQYCARTTCDNNGYPVYRRRNQGRTILKGNKEIGNEWVVPYNAYLSQKYNCHINVEICSTVASVKYIYKYIYKGHDRAVVFITRPNEPNEEERREGRLETNVTDEPTEPTERVIDVDEVKRYLSGRYVSAPEACWRLFSFDMQEKSHTVVQMTVHLPEQNTVTFDPATATEESIQRQKDTMLTRYFEKNRSDPNARDLLYHQMPKHYTWVKKTKNWQTRQQRGERAIGRMISVSPRDVERYHLRLLLCYVKGATSFEDLRTVEGVVYPTFQSAARARGLLEDDSEWYRCLEEAATFQMPQQLRQLFATILVCCQPSDSRALWDKFVASMSEDYQHRFQTDANDRVVVFHTLSELHRHLVSNGSGLEYYQDLPQLETFGDVAEALHDTNPLIEIERGYNRAIMEDVVGGVSDLNEDQLQVFTTVLDAVRNESTSNKCFFLDGPGGTGKSFLLEKILAAVRLDGNIAIAVATSGIAALQLTGGRTAHSTFKLSLKLDENSTCNFSLRSNRADLLRQTSLIVWDEAPMMHKHGFEALDRTLQHLMENRSPFGGKVVVFAGDFRQILPVVVRGTPADIVDACLQKSAIWQKCRTLRLTINMRVRCAENTMNAAAMDSFSEFLLSVGEDRVRCSSCGPGVAKIPKSLVVKRSEGSTNMRTLIDVVYHNIQGQYQDSNYFSSRAILTPLNVDVHDINNEVVTQLPEEPHEYRSIDAFEEEEGLDRSLFPVEFLNTLSIAGMPPHKLILKVGSPIILLRNIDGDQGLCNGTRLQVQALRANCLLATILTGSRKGNKVVIPRIPLISEDTGLPFKLRRRQFPVQLAFAMTINKAQGQTVHDVGLYLPSPVFSHGQLYVGLSRATSSAGIKIMLGYSVHEDDSHVCIDNHVYPGITI